MNHEVYVGLAYGIVLLILTGYAVWSVIQFYQTRRDLMRRADILGEVEGSSE